MRPGASEGETTFVTSSLPTALPGSTSVATGAEAADCRLVLAGAGHAAEASETVVASTRSGGRSSDAAASTLAAVLLFWVAICWLTSVVTDLWWALLIYIYIYLAAYIFWCMNVTLLAWQGARRQGALYRL